MTIQQNKEGTNIYNLVLAGDCGEVTKVLSGYAEFAEDQIIQYSPRKKINFHHYRQQRLKGHAEEGGIFNYEALAEGQLFSGLILGKAEELERFRDLFGPLLSASIGLSRNAQYGQVEIELGEITELNQSSEDKDFEIDEELVLTLVSPAILLNQYGYPEVSLEILTMYLRDALNRDDFRIEQSFRQNGRYRKLSIGVEPQKTPGQGFFRWFDI